ncbi:DNA glycosylase [Corynascus novoguineensis]|uniref:DNA glycosylase n=1 Tax=Corynascus novoguineensis TaxID=1126955 RepID=A0AAN7CV36_9PEZI|nr:DNA glycosylase [Corynascus novoguineensis]
MRTRAATRKVASAAVEVSNKVDFTAAPAESGQVLGRTENLGFADKQESSSEFNKGSMKRKHGEKKHTQPVKDGWVLPHGMGTKVITPDPSALLDAEITMPALLSAEPSPLSGLLAPKGSVMTSQFGSSTEGNAQARTKCTRLSLRSTKAGLQNLKEEVPLVKVEEANDCYTKQEDEHPRKRVRASATVVNAPTDVLVSNKEGLELNPVKAEETKTSNSPNPKVLIVRGIAIQDNIVTRISSKIAVDASRLLDPNLRRMVKRGKDNPYGLTPGFSPYPYRRVPTPEACEEVYAILTELHGKVKQPEEMPAASLEIAGCGEVPCVLDALLRTLISGNTLMALADTAIRNLARHYGLCQKGTGAGSIDWDKVRLSSHNELAQVIKVAGNGSKKSKHIKQILDMVFEENVQRAMLQTRVPEAAEQCQDMLTLDHMHGMTKDQAMAKFVSYPGIGIKTAACVTLFCLRLPCFAVDTHVHKFCRWLGWVPENADPDNCFRHGDYMVPDHLKYGLHQLFIRHGQVCFKCRKATKPGTKDWNEAPACPLEHLLDRSKNEAGSKAKQTKRVKKVMEENGPATDGLGTEVEDDDDEE